jgi:hypothetical protein
MAVLLAEDDVDLQFFAWRLVTANGFTVLTAGDGIVTGSIPQLSRFN